MQILKNLFSGLEELFFPEVCSVCFQSLVAGEKGICTGCNAELPRTHYRIGTGNPVERIFLARTHLDLAGSFLHFTRQNKTRQLMHEIKYKGNKELAFDLGKMYASELEKNTEFTGADVLLPVPLHPKKQALRGYNQATEFAKGLAEILGAKVDEKTIRRLVHHQSQTRKGRFDRWNNVSDKFGFSPENNIKGKRVFVVDDVITTGATLESCLSGLLAFKPLQLGVLTMAIAGK